MLSGKCVSATTCVVELLRSLHVEGDVDVLEGTADAAAGGDGRVGGGGEGGGEGGGDIDRLDEGGSVAESVEGSGELPGGL